MKKILVIIAAALAVIGIVSCSNAGTKPFEALTSDEIASVTLNCMPPDKTVETDDRDKIDELVKVLNKLVIYDEDEKEYAGQSVAFTLHKSDGTDIKITSYNPQLIIDGVKYTTKYEPCEELSKLGNKWADEIPSSHKSLQEIEKMLSSYPSEYESIMNNNLFTIVHGKVENGQELFDAFIESVNNGKAAEITIVQFTIEGDPIYGYLSYNGDDFYYVEDVSRDEFKGDYADYLEYSYSYLMNGSDENGSYAFLVNSTDITEYSQILASYDIGNDIDCKILFTTGNE